MTPFSSVHVSVCSPEGCSASELGKKIKFYDQKVVEGTRTADKELYV
jgi:hypothetical protein